MVFTVMKLPISMLFLFVVSTIQVLGQCQERFDNSTKPYMEKARDAMSKGRYQTAVENYTQAIKRGVAKSHPQAYQERGEAYQALNLPEQAIADYRHCESVFPDAKDTMQGKIALVHYDQKLYQLALDDCKGLAPFHDVSSVRGRVFFKFGKYAEAYKLLKEHNLGVAATGAPSKGDIECLHMAEMIEKKHLAK